MKVLGLDPGATSGWCLYDTEARRAIACGEFDRHEVSHGFCVWLQDPFVTTVIESVEEPHGNIYPQTVQSAITEGRLQQMVRSRTGVEAKLMSRHNAKLVLTEATQRTVVVTDDKTVWQALVLLHGLGSDRKPKRKKGEIVEPGGALGEVTGHARAALAVAVAWTLQPAAKEAAR